MKKIKIIQEQISFADVKEVLQQPEFWMYYLDKVEYVPLASSIAGPVNAALKQKHGDNVGAIASASSVVPFYKAVKSLSNAYTLAQKSLISVAQEAGVDVSEIEVKALLDRRKDVEDDLLASMTPQDRARAIEDQYKGRDGMSAEEYDEYLKGMERDEIKGEAAKRKPRKPRKPRKKGQKRKSSKHSDLYTDEDPKGTIHGLGFKDAATARKGRAIINKARRTHAHKVQAALVMKQRAKVAKERTKDPEKKKNLNAAYKVWSEYLEKLKAKTKKMKKNEAYVLEEGVMDSVYEFYNDLSIGFIKQFPDLGKNIKQYGSYLTYVPGGIGSIAAAAVFITNVLEGDEAAAKASLALIIASLVGAKTLAGAGMGIGALARSIRNFLPPTVLSRLGGARGLRTFIEKKALPTLNQYGANKVEEKVAKHLKAAEKFIGDKSELEKRIQNFRMRTVPTHVPIPGKPGVRDYDNYRTLPIDEKKRKHPRYRPPRKDPKTGKYDNPCGKGFAPGAQSGVKTKIGPQSGRRVSNCEPIKKKKNEAVLEAVLNRLLQDKNI